MEGWAPSLCAWCYKMGEPEIWTDLLMVRTSYEGGRDQSQGEALTTQGAPKATSRSLKWREEARKRFSLGPQREPDCQTTDLIAGFPASGKVLSL